MGRWANFLYIYGIKQLIDSWILVENGIWMNSSLPAGIEAKYYGARVQNNFVDWYANLLHLAWAPNTQNDHF